jgi:glycosyltransferase involved in cell wall biosynthesis
MKCVVVTNIPTPYRNPVFSKLPRDEFTVVYCAKSEGNRQWKLADPDFPHLFLKERISDRPDGYNFVHDNRDVWGVLDRLKPDVIVGTGLNPTHLYSFLWAKLRGARYVYMTDGTEFSESNLSWKHKALRHFVIRSSACGVAASESGLRLLVRYGLRADRAFLSRLCADNDAFQPLPFSDRDFDVLFCGQLHERKDPHFFLDVCHVIQRQFGRCKALVIGDGPERSAMQARAAQLGLDVTWSGFLQPEILPQWYARSRFLLFTTRMDPWGVVANEAMAAGTPVVTTPFAGVAGDLVLDGVNGLVTDADAQSWAKMVTDILESPTQWQRLSDAAVQHVKRFSYGDAADGLHKACSVAFDGR